jgi:hypothetical protein
MIEFILGVAITAALAYLFTREERDQHASTAEELWRMRARIRAVQDRGVRKGKEVVYTIQQPNGRFGKFTLPKV